MTDPLASLFPEIGSEERQRLEQLENCFREWNQRMNLVSRKDMEQFVLHHMAHSLALIKWVQFPERSRVLDVGTGGGLPGLPLAIHYPNTQFFLCDSIAKKARAVSDMASALQLDNVQVVNKRAEKLESTWEYVLGRAVTSLPKFLYWIRGKLRRGVSQDLPNGVLYWKGSLYREELASIGLEPHAVYPIQERLPDPYFEEKYIVHLTTDQVMRAQLPDFDQPPSR